MTQVIWTKASLAHALNSRMDQGKFPGAKDFIMPLEITDDVLNDWQEWYTTNTGNPLVIENEYVNLYHTIIAGFSA